MRSFVVAALLTACAMTVPACGKGGQAEVPVNAAAGRVVELTGKVEATRSGATRVLAVGGEVFRDDLVATNDGSVTIELFHNNARWLVEAAQKKRVDESLAWGLSKQDSPATTTQHATSAAGRNGERTAADTAATAHEKKEAQKQDALKQDVGDRKADLEKNAEKPTAAVVASGSGSAAPRPPPPPPQERPDKALKDPGNEVAKSEPSGHATTDDPRRRDQEQTPKRPENTKAGGGPIVLAARYEAVRAKLVGCLDATTPKLTLAITVKGGVATIGVPPGVPLAVATCLSSTVKSVPVTGDGTASLDLVR